MQLPLKEAEGFQRVEQRRQHSHDVVHHGLGHRRIPQSLLNQCSLGAFRSLKRSVDVTVTSKVTPS